MDLKRWISIVNFLPTDTLMPHIVASLLTFHSKPVTAMPPAAPVPARPINNPEPSELAKRDAPICSSVPGLPCYWHKKNPNSVHAETTSESLIKKEAKKFKCDPMGLKTLALNGAAHSPATRPCPGQPRSIRSECSCSPCTMTDRQNC